MEAYRKPIAILIVVLVTLVALWFKGGHFFCRVTGGRWSDAQVCVHYQESSTYNY